MVGELVTQRLLDLAGEQGAVVTEIAFEGVAIDHDPVFHPLEGDAVAEVMPVGVVLLAELGDDHRHPLQQPLEFLRQRVDRVRDQLFEIVGRHLLRHPRNAIRSDCPAQVPDGDTPTTRETEMKDDQPAPTTKPRALGAALAILAIAAGGVVWSGCGSDDNSTSSDLSNAQTEIEQGAEKAKEGVTEGVEEAKKGLEEAQKEIESGKGKASDSVEKARKETEKALEEGADQVEKGVNEAKEKAEELVP